MYQEPFPDHLTGYYYRCMAIIDFQKEAKQPGYRFDEMAEKDLFKEILKLVMDDSNTEVKNMAAQWYVCVPERPR
jgi:hypothetical protein